MTLSWLGDYNGLGAYPTINRRMTEALERQNVTVLRNVHNVGKELTPVSISCTYPPLAPHVKHAFNAVSLAWEFPGAGSIPIPFIQAFNAVDAIFSHSDWTAQQFRLVTDTPVYHTPLGFDPQEFTPEGAVVDWNVLFRDESWANDSATKFVLWVGGTDKRHGLDVAIDVIKQLPTNFHLIAKTSTDYPSAIVDSHPQVHIIRRDFVTLAPLFRGCDVFLNSARAVGFSMPTLEAMACGAKTVSSNCPPVLEFAENVYFSLVGEWQPFRHHIHGDISPIWWSPDIADLARLVAQAAYADKVLPTEKWVKNWSWDNAAKVVIERVNLVTT